VIYMRRLDHSIDRRDFLQYGPKLFVTLTALNNGKRGILKASVKP
jgi:hypothetical protein